jgi:hypothetical protein
VRELAPAGVEQLARHIGVAEDARVTLLEDAVARERPQQAVQDVGVDAGFARELGRGPRPVCKLLRDLEVRDDAERLRHERAAQEVPEDGFGRALAHSCLTISRHGFPSQSPWISSSATNPRAS